MPLLEPDDFLITGIRKPDDKTDESVHYIHKTRKTPPPSPTACTIPIDCKGEDCKSSTSQIFAFKLISNIVIWKIFA